MFRVSFNDGWEFRPKVSSFAEWAAQRCVPTVATFRSG